MEEQIESMEMENTMNFGSEIGNLSENVPNIDTEAIVDTILGDF